MNNPSRTLSGRSVVALACLVTLAACEGRNEKAGREADQAAAVAAGQNATGEGPNERLGEAQDRVDDANAEAADATADALERQGDQLRSEAGLAADRLDEKAKALRESTSR